MTILSFYKTVKNKVTMTLGLNGLVNGFPVEIDHVDDDDTDSSVHKFFSADEQAKALDALKQEQKLDTTYRTDLITVNAAFTAYLDRDTCILNGLLDKELQEKYKELPDDIKNLAVTPRLKETTSLIITTPQVTEQITIDKLHLHIKKIKDQMGVQLKADLATIEALFSKSSPQTDFEAALKTHSSTMTPDEIKKLKTGMLDAVKDANKNAVDTFNRELEDQYQKAENDHNLLLILAIVLKNDPKMLEKFNKQMNEKEAELNAGAPSSGLLTTVHTQELPMRKLHRDVASNIVSSPKLASNDPSKNEMSSRETPWFGGMVEGAFFTSITGQSIRHPDKSKYHIQVPARIPCGPVARCLAELLFDVKMRGSYFSNYYSSWQDNIKIEYLSMAERLWADGYRTAVITIDHSPKNKEMTHALEHAQKACAACCEAGFKVENLTFKINGHTMALFDKQNDKGETIKGIFKSQASMNAMVEKAELKVKKKESVLPREMLQMGEEVKKIRAETQKREADAKKEAESAVTPQKSS